MTPFKPLRPCNHPGCRNLSATGYCDIHRKEKYQDDRKSSRQRGYDTQWEKVRAVKLRRNPICEDCGVIAAMVHHKRAIADGGSRYDMDNLKSLCWQCHGKY
jgi:5-methylcytosine-specific restriction enzyme A